MKDVEDNIQEEGVPYSERIVHDCDKALSAMEIVYENGGEIVPGLANRNGDRYSKRGTKQHGGKRNKGYVLKDCRWVHPLARSARSEKQRNVQSRYLACEG